MEVHQGEVLGLIGPNGSGKTTLFNVITGVFRPTAGRVLFRGEDITGLKPHQIAHKGMVRTFQLMNLWSNLHVMDSMRVAFHMKSNFNLFATMFNTPSYHRNEGEVDEKAMEILKFVGMEHLTEQQATTLSSGYQKTMSIAIAMATRPPLLLLDEPVAALSPERSADIMALIRRVRDEETTVVIVEHNMKAIFSVCDRIIVLNAGAKIAEGTPAEIKENEEVIKAYLGRRSVA